MNRFPYNRNHEFKFFDMRTGVLHINNCNTPQVFISV